MTTADRQTHIINHHTRVGYGSTDRHTASDTSLSLECFPSRCHVDCLAIISRATIPSCTTSSMARMRGNQNHRSLHSKFNIDACWSIQVMIDAHYYITMMPQLLSLLLLAFPIPPPYPTIPSLSLQCLALLFPPAERDPPVLSNLRWHSDPS